MLMVDGAHSQTGNPLMVGGPQIGYFYPGFTYEIDMDARRPALARRDLGAVPRLPADRPRRGLRQHADVGERDIIDQYVETLCNGSGTKYEYKGKCRRWSRSTRARSRASRSIYTTVHGPVAGYARVKGERVAISSKRSSYGKDGSTSCSSAASRTGGAATRLLHGRGALTPQTFNSFYMDNQNIAKYTSGLLPNRHENVDPGLLTKGNGKYEWKGPPDEARTPGREPVRRDDRELERERPTRASAPPTTSRPQRLGKPGRPAERTRRARRADGKWASPAVASAMNAAATQDVRAIDTVPLLHELLPGSKAAPRRPRRAARPDDRLARSRAAAAWTSTWTARSTAPGAASMDAPGRGSPTRS